MILKAKKIISAICLIHNVELVWNGKASICPKCYELDPKYKKFVDNYKEVN